MTMITPRITHPWVAAGKSKIRFGVNMLNPGPDWIKHRDWVQMIEGLGFDSYWVADHPMILPDCWTVLTMLATTTEKIRLGSLVNCVYYRRPELLARIAADVDRLSNGRLVLGIGIGDLPREFAQMGLPFHRVSERQQVLEETLQIVSGLWGDTPFTYQGTHFQVHEAKISPPPIQQPRVPILISGAGERVSLRQVACYADISNFGRHALARSVSGAEDVARKYEVLRSHCETVGRPYESILRSYYSILLIIAETHEKVQAKLNAMPPHLRALFEPAAMAGTPSEIIALCQALVHAGVEYFTMSILTNDTETLEFLAQEVMPAFKEPESSFHASI